jgi:D-xylose transport system permease protein
MVLMGLETPLQQVVVGAVLVLAVMIDTYYRRRTA